MTYAESKGEAPFDWNEFLASPPALESDVHDKACDLASRWVTCACGNLCYSIPRRTQLFGEPEDRELSRLGVDFSNSIDDGCWEAAKVILERIEQRSSEILKSL